MLTLWVWFYLPNSASNAVQSHQKTCQCFLLASISLTKYPIYYVQHYCRDRNTDSSKSISNKMWLSKLLPPSRWSSGFSPKPLMTRPRFLPLPVSAPTDPSRRTKNAVCFLPKAAQTGRCRARRCTSLNSGNVYD